MPKAPDRPLSKLRAAEAKYLLESGWVSYVVAPDEVKWKDPPPL